MTMETVVYLVRHGETVDNALQIMQGQTHGCLNEKGREQARIVAERLAGEAFDAVVASDLQRAIQTAEIIAAPHGLPVVTTPLLRERDWGGFTGRFIPDLRDAVWPGHGIFNKALLAVYAGCTMREVQRMMNAEVRILTVSTERAASAGAVTTAATVAAERTTTAAAPSAE